jgi:drug/metabolite transporter superfamily protein YnfA
MLLLGLTFGATVNILIFRAVASAPNPGLPVAIANVASVGVFLVAALLARWAPNYFDSVKTDGWSFLGVVLTVIGAALIAIRR